MKGLFTPHKLTYCTTHQSILQQIYIGLMVKGKERSYEYQIRLVP